MNAPILLLFMVFGTCDGLNSPPIVIRWTLSSYPGPKQRELCIYPQAGNLIFPKLLRGLPLTHLTINFNQSQLSLLRVRPGKTLPLTQLRANTLGMFEAYLGPVFSEQIGQFRETFMVHLCPALSGNLRKWMIFDLISRINWVWMMTLVPKTLDADLYLGKHSKKAVFHF